MRITGGEFKGRNLNLPERDNFRPTSNKVKEAIFSTLAAFTKIDNLDVLDLYAGSGALGIEALSRGARNATFIESDRVLTDALTNNIKLLNVQARTQVITAKVNSALKNLKREFQIIFADPPYATGDIVELCAFLLAAEVVTSATVLVFETDSKHAVPQIKNVELLREKRYGDTVVQYFKFVI